MIDATVLTTGARGATASSYNTASITPVANRPVFVCVWNKCFGGTANAPAISGCNITWEIIDAIHPAGDSTITITMYKGISSAPTSGALTISFAGQNQDFAVCWQVVQFANTKKTNYMVQYTYGSQNSSSETLTLTLGTFGSSNNATFAFFGGHNASVWTPGSGFTELAEADGGSANTCQTEFKRTADTSVESTTTKGPGNVIMGGIAVELAAEQFPGVMM